MDRISSVDCSWSREYNSDSSQSKIISNRGYVVKPYIVVWLEFNLVLTCLLNDATT